MPPRLKGPITSKTCSRCGVHKGADAFRPKPYPSGTVGLTAWCNGCKLADDRRRRAKMDVDEKRAKGRAYYHKDPKQRRAYKLRVRYNITLEEEAELLRRQLGRCAICNDPMQRHHVDHDHDTGVIRGLLCSRCNQGLGIFRDNPEILVAAAKYLQSQRDLRITA